MKTQLLKFAALLFILTGIASSCNHEEEYPKDISYKEYSFLEPCRWQNLPYDEKVVIVNSNQELEKYISCNGCNYPAIDFSKQTLLLVSGKTNGSIYELSSKSLQKLSPSKYKLSLEIILNNDFAIAPWGIAFTVEKMNVGGYVELNLTLQEVEVDYPIEISFEEYSLEGTSCQWEKYEPTIDLLPYTLVTINSNEELENYIDCNEEKKYPEIDFSRKTLLLTYGVAKGATKITYKSIQQLSINEYQMTMNIHPNLGNWISYWHVPLIVSKLDDVSIELIVTYNYK
jgi:hypothetical protein